MSSSEMPPFAMDPSMQDALAAHRARLEQAHRVHRIAVQDHVAVQDAADITRNAALLDSPASDQHPEFLLQAVIIPGEKTPEGILVKAVAIAWYEIIRRIVKDPAAMYQIHWRNWEEIIAGAYIAQGWEVVTLTPRSGDEGKDVIAVRRDIGELRFFDQVKCYKPGHVVKLQEVDSMLGVLSRDSNVSKGIVTTTSTFAPELLKAEGITGLIPFRLELRDRSTLLPWLESLLPKK